MTAQNARPRRALVLSGGGARGAYEAGVVSALFEREDFDIVCGTSIGAINAALAAQGASGKLRDLWLGVPERAVIRGVSPLEELHAVLRRGPSGKRRTFAQFVGALTRVLGALRFAHPRRLRTLTHVLDPAPMVAMLATVLDYTKLERALVIGVTNLTRARPEAFYSFPEGDAEHERAFADQEWASVRLASDNYLSAILASAAIPLAFPKVAVTDRNGVTCEYIDGGVGNNTPIRQAIDAGADEITVVIADHLALRDRDQRLDDLGSIALVAQDILQQQVLELDLKLARRVNEAVLHGGAPDKRFVNIRTIGPSIVLPLPVLGFQDLATIERAFDQGLVDGRGACDSAGLSRLFVIDPTARAVAAGETIFTRGERGDEMYVVREGSVNLSIDGVPLATAAGGDIFGETALLGTGTRAATAVVSEAGTIVPIDFARFQYLVQYAPSFALFVMRTMARRLRALDGREELAFVQALAETGDPAHMAAHLDHFRADPNLRSFVAGETIFAEGDPGGSMFVIVEGEVSVARAGVPIGTAKTGEMLGELSLCDHEPRGTTAIAATAARLAPIDAMRFTFLVQNDPNFAIAAMRAMAGRMHADGPASR
jgi:CRP-like cAMP-binding protein/predicted acylesterase/phospholipase RssA